MARHILNGHEPENIYPRFLRAELRLSSINTINRFTRSLEHQGARSWVGFLNACAVGNEYRNFEKSASKSLLEETSYLYSLEFDITTCCIGAPRRT